jgi:hypothetical protein
VAEYDNAIAVARRLIYRKGRVITLIKPSVTNSDVDVPWRGDTTAEPSPAVTRTNKAVFTSFKKNEIDGTNILASDYLITMPVGDSNDVEITEEQMDSYKLLVDGSKKYRIVNFDVVKPGEQIIIYKIQARI